ncbi:MAG: dipeptide ABC transporter ATP-binding protein [Deltaproteobacteria bacterium]|nr:dipeptide ABC transporter ATP-binding protein [Deltaproteobacteria bacterium]
MSENLLEVRDLRKYFPLSAGLFSRRRGEVRAVDGVSFDLAEGETLGLVGESGCGKSTLGRAILRLIEPTAGKVTFQGEDVLSLDRRALRAKRRQMQIIFQDPYASLNPRMQVGDIVGEALTIHGIASGSERRERIVELLRIVGLAPEAYGRYAHEFSGGQRQRIGIARALAVIPKLIIADEPVSALDVSIQAQILNLLLDLQERFELTYLFISHDLRVVKNVSDRVAVMYLGKIVELAGRDALYKVPLHPYTQALLSAIPLPDPRRKKRRIILQGDVPSPINPPPGCAFHTRCAYAEARCREESPGLREILPGHFASCHFAPDVGRENAAS